MTCCSKLPFTGRLDKKVTIQKLDRSTKNAIGGYDSTWIDITETWAKIVPKSAGQRLWSKQLNHEVSHKIYMRYRSDLTSEMRLVYQGRVFQIQGIINIDENNRYLDISAKEGVES